MSYAGFNDGTSIWCERLFGSTVQVYKISLTLTMKKFNFRYINMCLIYLILYDNFLLLCSNDSSKSPVSCYSLSSPLYLYYLSYVARLVVNEEMK